MKVETHKEKGFILPTLAIWWGQEAYNDNYRFSISVIVFCFEIEFLFFKKK